MGLLVEGIILRRTKSSGLESGTSMMRYRAAATVGNHLFVNDDDICMFRAQL
jgi:hypothetical protein